MFKIYIKDFNQNGRIISTETLVEEIPAKEPGELKFISPIVKAEMGNVEGLDFSIQAGTKFFDAFLQMKTYIRVVYDGTTIFYGRVLTIDNNPFKGTRKVRCEGPLSFLMDSAVEGKEEEARPTISVLDYMNQLINNHNSFINNETNKRFQLGEVPGQYSGSVSSDQRISNESRKFGADGWTDTKAALEDLRSHYGGYFRVRMGTIGSKLTLDWMDHYFNNTVIDQAVEVGKNILDISDVTEVDNIFTAIIPIGRTNISSTDSSTGATSSKQSNLYIDGKILRVPDIIRHFSDAQLNRGYHKKSDYANAINKYGMIIKTVSLTDCSTKTKLYDEACKWILNNYQGEVTKFTVKAIDMHQIGERVTKISVGDRVKIIYPVGNEDGTFRKESIVQTCLSIQYDLYHPENNSYTFGIPANILTKTYGLSKQKGSVSSTPDTKPKSVSYPSSNKPKWINLVIRWLMDHKFYFRGGPMPYKPEFDDNGVGERFMSGPVLFRAGSGGWLIKAENMLPQQDTTTTIVTMEALMKNKVLDWVLHEYGIDLTTYFEGVAPEPFVTGLDTDTGKMVTSALTGFLDGALGVYNWFKVSIGPVKDTAGLFGNALLSFLNLSDPDNPEQLGCVDQNGNFNWYYFDPKTGQKVGTNTRDLAVTTVNNENFIGTVVEDGYYDSDGNTHVYKFGQEIENWADSSGSNSKLVVAHVDGDVIRIGSERTQFATTVATKVNGVFLSPIEFITGTDPTTGQASAIHIGAAGQASYRARWDNSKGCYVYDPNGSVTLTGDGFWDEKNLAIKGGVYTVYENNHYVSYVKSGQLVIGSNQQNTRTSILEALRTSNVIDGNDSPESLTTSALFVEQVNALNVRCTNIETNYLRTNLLTTTLANADNVNVKRLTLTNNGYISLPTGDGNITITGSRFVNILTAIQVVDAGNNSYKIQKRTYGDVEWEDIPNTTFSRATTLSGAWSSGTYTVSASPQGNTISTTLQYLTKTAPGSSTPSEITRSGKSVTQRHYMMYGPDEDHLSSTGFSQPITIDASSVYSNAWHNANGQVSLPGVSSSSSFTFAWPSGTVDSSTSRTYELTDNGNDTVIARYLQNETYYTIASYTHNKYTAGWQAANRKVSLPGVSSSSSFEFSWPTNTVGSQSSRTYSIVNNGDNAVIVRYYEGETPYTIASYTHNKYTAGWNAAVNNRQSKTLTWTSNGTYTVGADSGYTGLSSVKVTVSVSAPSVSSIDLGNIAISPSQPTGYEGATLLTKLANSIKNNRNTYVWFKVRALNSSGGVLYTKNYYCASA